MGKPDAFLTVERKNPPRQPVSERLGHWREIYLELAEEELKSQASRCMECGVPFCHSHGCPLGNLIPEFNDLMHRGRWRDACNLLHLTNNFPEITGRVCPALCEAACTLGLDDAAVTVRWNELSIVEKGFAEGWILPEPPRVETGKKIAVIGSGPAGLAAAQQLRRAGHEVSLYEKADRLGGILRYGIPDFKLEKKILDRRLAQLQAEGVKFETEVNVGTDISPGFLLRRFDAVCLCLGAGSPRDLPAPGRDLDGVFFAMKYLVQQNRRVARLPIRGPEISAAGRKVVVIGGGDTGADCLGTALRQGAASVHQLEILPKPPTGRDPANPWPNWPNILRFSAAHEEGGERRWCVATSSFQGRGGRVARLEGHEVRWFQDAAGRMMMEKIEGSEFEMDAQLVLLAMGFTQPVHEGLLDNLGLEYDARGNVRVDDNMMTSIPKVFAAGDSVSGAWLVVRAIAAGRGMARRVDEFLMGESALPDTAPVGGLYS
ncbi:MAG: glutamate synthase subunit beta [Pseudomonadota bacterium]